MQEYDHVAHLIYSVISSLDGYSEDTDGKFDWAMPDEVVHRLSETSIRKQLDS